MQHLHETPNKLEITVHLDREKSSNFGSKSSKQYL